MPTSKLQELYDGTQILV